MNDRNPLRSARRVGSRIVSVIGDAHPFLAGAIATIILMGAGLAGTATTYSGPASAGIYWGDCYTANVGFEVRGDFGPFERQC